MPNISIPIEDLQDSVERPVILSVVRDILDITQISDKTPISFYGDEGKAAQLGSLINSDKSTFNKWPFNERVNIEVDEQFDESMMLSIHTKQPEHQPVFLDSALGVCIRPIYSPTKVEITFNYRARDKNQAQSWRNQMRAKVAMYRQINLHELSYHVHLNEELFIIIKEIHRMREAVAGYNEPFDTYFARNLSDRASIKTNLGGVAVLWGIDERQIRVQGSFDFEGAPEKGEKDSDGDSWSISFTYRFEYQKPILMNMTYPLVVHNQVLDSKYRPAERAYKVEDQLTRRSLSSAAYAAFETDTASLKYTGRDGVSIPDYDEFIPGMILPSTINIVTCLVVVDFDSTNPRKLMNLRELGDVGLNSKLLDFIASSEYPFMGEDFKSIISLSLYRHSGLMESGSVMIDSNLDVYCTFDPDLRKTYRIRLGLVTNLSYLPIAALNRIRDTPGIPDLLVESINYTIANYASHPDIGKNKLSDIDVKVLGATPYGVSDAMYDPLQNSIIPAQFPVSPYSAAARLPAGAGRVAMPRTVQSQHIRSQRKN